MIEVMQRAGDLADPNPEVYNELLAVLSRHRLASRDQPSCRDLYGSPVDTGEVEEHAREVVSRCFTSGGMIGK